MALPFHGPEEGGHLVVVVLSPFFVRMVAALCAFETDPEENAADVGAHAGGLSFVAPDCDWPVIVAAAFGRQQFADEGIVGYVFAKSSSNPSID